MSDSGSDPGIPEAAFRELGELYEKAERALSVLDLRCRRDGACCRFADSGLRLFTTGLEAAYLVYRAGALEASVRPGVCPYLEGNLCTARAGRPLGCRIYFCDPEEGSAANGLYERFHREIAGIHERHGLNYVYAELLLHPLFSGESP